MIKSRKHVLEELVETTTNAITEQEVKLGFYWQLVREGNEANDEKASRKAQLEVATIEETIKRYKQWLAYLTNELETTTS